MPGLYKDEGVVLRTVKLGEADRIVTLFTRFNGKVRAVAKGIRRTKSRFGGRLEPYTRAALVLYQGRGELDTVTQVDVVDSYKGIRESFERTCAAAMLCELTEKITPERERTTPTYALMARGLEALATGGGAPVVPGFMVKLLSLSGYHPQLTSCAGCGNGARLCAFSAALGGAACEACARKDGAALPLNHQRIALLQRLLASDFGIPADLRALSEVTRALARYAEYHLERPLKSLDLLPL